MNAAVRIPDQRELLPTPRALVLKGTRDARVEE